MSPQRSHPGCIIEPLDAVRHDRASFASGVEQVDNFFRKTAKKLAKADNLRVFVMVGPGQELIGFYALNAHAVDYRDLPAGYARTRPRHGNIPVAFLSMMGVDHRFAGKGFGGDLLVDALLRIERVADDIGIAAMLLDVLNYGDAERIARRRRFYEGFGFSALPSNGLRLFLPIATVRRLIETEGR